MLLTRKRNLQEAANLASDTATPHDTNRLSEEGKLKNAGPGRVLIEIRSVTKIYATRQGASQRVLDAVDLDIMEGQVTCLVGPSGCGKTTLLNLIAGFDSATSGLLKLDGTLITTIASERAVVFQQPALFPWMNVLANVMVASRAQGNSVSTARPAAMELIERVGLVGSEHLYPYQLSGGMKQRVQIARALLCRPRVLLMDEPFGALDAQTRLSLQEGLLELVESIRPTVIFVTHDAEEATLLGNRIIVMSANPGRIRESIDVVLPAPRSYETLANEDFVATKYRLLTLLHDQTIS